MKTIDLRHSVLRLGLGSLMVGLLAACSSAPVDQISSSAEPTVEIRRLSDDLAEAQKSNVDVLDRKNFLKAESRLEETKESLRNGEPQKNLIESLRYGREDLRLAKANSAGRMNKVPGIFAARQSAMRAGAVRSQSIRKEFAVVDSELAAYAGDLDSISADNVERFQARYVAVEKKSVIEGELGSAQAQISGARTDGATKLTPRALRMAEISLGTAESAIGSSLRNSQDYRSAVMKANADAAFLTEVLGVVKSGGKGYTEAAASQVVRQKQKISDLNQSLTQSQQDVEASEDRSSEKSRMLNRSNVALNKAQSTNMIQAAMEKSRQQFPAGEAEAYQQGNKLLIRLKSMNFPSGQSDLPPASLALLAKVSEVARSLNAEKLVVEGHTDSTGTAKANLNLSELRARAVASYFESTGFEKSQVVAEGHGFQHPIATNKTKEGRAQNRRVDVVITPLAASTVTQ